MRWLLLVFLAVSSVAAQITLTPAMPVAGEPVTIQLDTPSAGVQVVYRPGSSLLADTMALGSGQTLTWTPREAGLAAVVTAEGGRQNVAIRTATLPISGLFVMVIAGLILFGGAILSLRVLFDEGPPYPDEVHRADT